MIKKRLDLLLAEKNLAPSRSIAAKLISDYKVRVNGELISKQGKEVDEDALIEVIEAFPYVSRGGYKLAHALDTWSIEVAGCTALDIGASTGGFTDCLLQRGASHVYAVDVGRNQLAPSLRVDPRVTVFEHTDIRTCTIPELVDIIVIDVSFISLTKIFPSLHKLIRPGGIIVALIKPQFEVGKDRIGKNGIVKTEADWSFAIDTVKSSAMICGFNVVQVIDSPISGGSGNKEFLAYLTLTSD